MHFSKNLVVRSSAGSKILAFGSHCSADCFIPSFKLKYQDSENINADRVNTVVFNLHKIKRQAFFLGHPVCKEIKKCVCKEIKNSVCKEIKNSVCQELALKNGLHYVKANKVFHHIYYERLYNLFLLFITGIILEILTPLDKIK